MIKNTLVSGLVAVIVSVGLFLAFPKQVVQQFGANAGPDFFNRVFLDAGYSVGGSVATLTASATTTSVTAAQLCPQNGQGIISWAPNATNSTATLPTTLSVIQNCGLRVGDYVEFEMRNASTSGVYQVVAGTGQTAFHLEEAATTTSQGLTINSSTPILFRLVVNVVSSTDSTASLYQTNYLKP